jgi:hypothetical protein
MVAQEVKHAVFQPSLVALHAHYNALSPGAPVALQQSRILRTSIFSLPYPLSSRLVSIRPTMGGKHTSDYDW